MHQLTTPLPVGNRLSEPAQQLTRAEDLPTGLYEALKAVFEKDRAQLPYHIIPHTAELTDYGTSYRASNPQQQLQIDFTEEAIWVKRAGGRKANWEFGF